MTEIQEHVELLVSTEGTEGNGPLSNLSKLACCCARFLDPEKARPTKFTFSSPRVETFSLVLDPPALIPLVLITRVLLPFILQVPHSATSNPPFNNFKSPLSTRSPSLPLSHTYLTVLPTTPKSRLNAIKSLAPPILDIPLQI